MRYILLFTVLLTSNAFAKPDFDETMAAAKQGHAYAQHNLGVMYSIGEGVPKNEAEAVKWYRKAADQGNAYAQFNLASKYNDGKGVPENYAEAAKWYRKAADQGLARAQHSLGFYYANGIGLPENYIRAYVWWSMAKTQDLKEAAESLDDLKSLMTKQQIGQAQALAIQCYESNYKDCD